MRLLRRFIRIYTPFICTIVALIHGMLFLSENLTSGFEYLASSSSGFSILVVLYFFSASKQMCFWYKANLTCLLLIQISGLLYYFDILEITVYFYVVTLFAALGIMFFLVFQVFYTITEALLCIRKDLLEPERR